MNHIAFVPGKPFQPSLIFANRGLSGWFYTMGKLQARVARAKDFVVLNSRFTSKV
jgi:hypothetical protein